MGKYNDRIAYGRFNWPVKFKTKNMKNLDSMNNPNDGKDKLVKEIHFDTLFKLLKSTDWAKTPIYEQFCEHGRWLHSDE